MKLKIPIVIFYTSLLILSCDLERIELGSGNATKFETSVGGNKNDFPYDIITTSDGGYLIAGYSQSFTQAGDNQAYLVKLDNKGGQIWEANFGGTSDDYAKNVVETSDGGFILCGYTRSFNASNNADIYLVKVNALGAKVWEKSYGAIDTIEEAFDIIPIGTSDFYVATSSKGPNQQSSYINLLRINANGSKISVKTVRTANIYIYEMIKTSDSKIVLAGYIYDTNGTDSYILKLNEDGSYVWENQFPSGNNNYTPAFGVTELSNKDLVLTGSDLGANDHDFNLVSFNQIGGNNWDETWGGASADELLGIDKTIDNQLIVMGYTGSFSGKTEIYLSKRSSTDGSKIWEKNFVEIGNIWGAMASCPDGGFVLCAGQNVANADIIIIKTDSEGNYK